MKILIVGAGIAGPTLAYWLGRYGFEATVVEQAGGLRAGGYLIDFWGAGYDIADRMGALPEIMRDGYRVQRLRVVNQDGKRTAGFPVDAFTRVTGGRYITVARTDLAAAIFARLGDGVERIFGDSVTQIERTSRGVEVKFEHEAAREFDLVVGADGLHSRVRELVYGPQNQFEQYLGYKVAAFEAEGYQPRDELTYVMYTEVGQQIGRFSQRDNRTLFLFTFSDPDPSVPGKVQDQKAALRKRYAGSGWECPKILDALDACGELYFDRVSQIRMPAEPGSWSRDRVTLVGDAAWCVSLLAGQGSALAMIGAYILAGELHRAQGDHGAAFARYQELFGPFVLMKQQAALRFAGAFAPKSRTSLFLRNQVLNLLTIPWIADWAFGRDFVDRIALQNY
ncbi:MAG TPA: FAD-binding domain [Candidatus Angelobacter sp.]|nr:FAD-binding domain [Candidatus Angelobacter sp.]